MTPQQAAADTFMKDFWLYAAAVTAALLPLLALIRVRRDRRKAARLGPAARPYSSVLNRLTDLGNGWVDPHWADVRAGMRDPSPTELEEMEAGRGA